LHSFPLSSMDNGKRTPGPHIAYTALPSSRSFLLSYFCSLPLRTCIFSLFSRTTSRGGTRGRRETEASHMYLSASRLRETSLSSFLSSSQISFPVGYILETEQKCLVWKSLSFERRFVFVPIISRVNEDAAKKY